ncbi:uncharacterized protein LALA0_S08e00672g [Lachancea lanzarotensis]|uniref:LALA0S08e00672g1_1 n=1 Tax=Lachancea lanzarotensis TaxID=1245769 RepID=A0A0C7NCH9_9SACH|nr:uncharacterized protein LALA0_S08e00672g [Lachancea lanzarotensis]CEP63361.1 LALA0S08e00672g1_1 [Lachancea lanzarotensis]
MNSKSPTKVRRALSGKNVNHRSNNFSPKRAELLPKAQSKRSSPTRTSPTKNGGDPLGKTSIFHFFEESAESQDLVTLKQEKLRSLKKNKPLLVADDENNAKHTEWSEQKVQISPARQPMADLNVDDHAGTWEVYTTENSESRSPSKSPSKSLSSKSIIGSSSIDSWS